MSDYIHIRVSEQDKAELKARAKRCDMSVTSYILHCCLHSDGYSLENYAGILEGLKRDEALLRELAFAENAIEDAAQLIAQDTRSRTAVEVARKLDIYTKETLAKYRIVTSMLSETFIAINQAIQKRS